MSSARWWRAIIPRALVFTWADPGEGAPPARAPTRVTFDIEPGDGIVRLTLTHDELASEEERDALAEGWSAVLSNLKT